nr:MAG TPA: hypothetical protein [Caudoviricetes sp.]
MDSFHFNIRIHYWHFAHLLLRYAYRVISEYYYIPNLSICQAKLRKNTHKEYFKKLCIIHNMRIFA